MSGLRPVEIVGGGLAGLTLGLSLQRAGVPAVVHEASNYPRHRVCGEFITGLDGPTLETLGLSRELAGARRARELAFFSGHKRFAYHVLPSPAYLISRAVLDARLASAFVEAGGKLKTHSPIDVSTEPDARVICSGRRRDLSSPWLGLKCHARGIELKAELELHLGRHAYVGLCAVDDTTVNVCGLFRKRAGLGGSAGDILPTYLRAAGLGFLAQRLEHAKWLNESSRAVAGFNFSGPPSEERCIRLGDAYAMIAPFTGNGMTIAFQSAAEALAPLIAWSRGEQRWEETCREISRRLRRRFARRLRAARLVHPFLLSPAGQRCLRLAQRLGLVPIGPWYSLLH